MNVKGEMKITADCGVEITCGGSTIKMTPDKIAISSANIEITGSSSVAIACTGGDVTIKGGPMVKINT